MSPRRMLVAAALLGAACADPVSTRQNDSLIAAGGLDANAQVIHASGNGQADVTSPAPAIGTADFTFSVTQSANGEVQGFFRMIRPRAGFTVDFSGIPTCISIDPVNHRAWIGGVVTENRSDDPNHSLAIHGVGRDVWFRVANYGQGNESIDRTSVYGFEGAAGVITSAEYCQRQLWTANDVNAFVVTQGNITISPK